MTSSIEPPDRPDALGVMMHLWQLIQSVLDESDPALEAIGLSAKAFFLLTSVEEHPFPAELARKMHLPPPSVTYLVKQMEERKYLKRRTELGDLRKFRLVLTASGRKAIGQGQAALARVMAGRLERIEAAEVAPLLHLVRRLADPTQ